jgi:long-chain acyl-CoA synthetase
MTPMYEAQLPSDWSYILNDAGCEVLFCANQSIFDRVNDSVKKDVPTLKHVLAFDAKEGGHNFHTAMAKADAKATVLAPTPDDLANLIYTSGTTGKPKGVELTHRNQISNLYGVRQTVSDPLEFMRKDDRSLSFLPWAHSYGQTCELYSMMAHGAAIGVCRGVPDILEDLQLVKPSILFSVPTLYKRVYDGVQNMIETTNPIRRGLMKKALALGEEAAECRENGTEMGMIAGFQHSKLDGLVLSKIRDRFGGNLRHGFVAGAACPKDIIKFMDSIGICCCEGYGLTETSPVVSINSPEYRKVGSVGLPIGGVDVFAIDDDGNRLPKGQEGEICVVGPNIMKGYHNKQEATDEVVEINKEGNRMFHTGDLGKVDDEGYVYITGRLKEQFKLENGKYVVPTPVEEAVGMSRFIMQIVLCGANRPHNVCLIVPDVEALRAECKLGADATMADMEANADVIKLMDQEILDNSKELKKFEVPTKWCFVDPFTVENQMMTPKMSIRRHMAIKNYEDKIAKLYEV